MKDQSPLRFITAAFAVLCATMVQSRGGTFTNGSFEDPVFSEGSHFLPAGSTNVTGWVSGGTGPMAILNGLSPGIPSGPSPADGIQQIAFINDGAGGIATISQEFLTMVGQTYEVSFQAAASVFSSPRILAEVSSGTGDLLGSLTAFPVGGGGYGAPQSFTFAATTTNSTIKFSNVAFLTGAASAYLDNVKIVEVDGGCFNPPPELVGWWQGNGNTIDVIGGNDGVWIGGASYDSGEVGQAFNFNGIDSQLRFGNGVGNFGTNDFTLEFWMRTTSTRLESVIEKWPVCAPSSEWYIRIGGGVGAGHLNLEMESSSLRDDYNVLVSTRAVNDGVFHHVALMRKGTNLAFYIDGVLDVSTNSSGGVTRINNTADMVAGRSVCVGVDGTSPFTGQMDEISIYSRALLETEIQAVYQAGSAGKCPPPLVCVTPPAGLVGWWRGEGDVNDSASTNDGGFVGGAAFAAGEVGQAFSFGGANHVTIPASSNLNVQSLTIEGWVFPDDVSALKPIVEYAAAGGDPGLHLWHSVRADGGAGVSPGSLYANIGDAFGPYRFGTAAGAISSNQWTHVALTYDQPSGVAQLYVNGVNLASTNFGSTTPLTALPVNLGYRPSSGEHFVGRMDEVSIYDRALTASEIQALFNASDAGKCDPSITSEPAGRTVPVGAELTFTVKAAGTPPLSYQWSLDGTNLVTANASSLTLTNVQLTDAGSYRVTVSNATGFLISSNAMLTIAAPVCVPAFSGLANWWQAEGNAQDATSTNTGVLTGGVDFSAGEVGQAFRFDGTNGRVKFGPAAGNFGTNDFTVEFWLRTTSTRHEAVIEKWPGCNASSMWAIRIGSTPPWSGPGRLEAQTISDASGNDVNAISAGRAINDGLFHQVVFLRKGTDITFYIDGVQDVVNSSLSGTVSRIDNATDLMAGNSLCVGRDGTRPFTGQMDELTIYNRALSESEIQTSYLAGGAGKCALPLAIATQPQSQTVLPGSNAVFSVTVTGTQPVNYQWSVNSTNIAGATGSSITLTNVRLENIGDYRVSIGNSIGSVVSDPATLKVVYLTVFGNGQPLTNAQYTFLNSVNVELKSQFTNGATFYTLDGSTPTFGSTLYTGSFVLGQPAVVRAIAYSADFLQSWQSDPITVSVVPTFTITASSLGGGVVSIIPPSGPYGGGSVVEITATPTNGWTFLGWNGDAIGTNTTTAITMNRNKSVQAIFGTTLGTTVAGNGSISLIPPGGVYPYGTVVRLYAAPQSGSYFALWGNAASGNSNPLVFTLTNASPTVSSLFAALGAGEYTLTVVPDGFGLVTVTPQASRYTNGSSVTLTAVPGSGQQFVDWSGDATGTNNPLPVLMSQSKTIGAGFTAQPTLSLLGDLDNLTEAGVTLTLVGKFGGDYRIDGSTNLPAWTPLLTITNTFGSAQFTDESATNQSLRFYRAVEVP